MTLSYKATGMELKAAKQAGEYDGHFSVFHNVDDGGDITERGAFAKTLGERGKRVKVLHGHDWDKLVGPTPELKEDEFGLYAKGRLTLDSFWGKETWALLADGVLSEGSYGYMPVKFDDDERGIRHLREVKLYEISFVPLGMNPLTAVRAIKAGGLPEAQLLPLLTETLAALRDGRFLVTAPAQQLKQFRQSLVDLQEMVESQTPEPPKKHSAVAYRLRAARLALAQLEMN